ncbi:MAG TPA: fused MFS/spermidine synthase [Bryobacteraceae bacterium]
MPDGPQPLRASRCLPLLLVLFGLSGCAALIYEIVWYQLLQLAIGSTAISLGFLLAAYMGGLCAGSLGLAHVAAQRHPLRIYAALEFGIAAFAALALAGIPLVDRIYIAGAEHGMPGFLSRAAVAGGCLLPPTVLMGASLPALARWVESTPGAASWWGALYAANTAGAVLGCLLAGFYLLRIYNTAIATWFAVAVNLVVAAISYALSKRTPAPIEGDAAPAEPRRSGLWARHWPVYVTIALSGAGALGAEVVWTRLVAMLLGSTVYVFSIILAVFLIGLAIGSGVGSGVVRSVRPQLALGWCQALLAGGIAWTAYMISDSLPYWPIDPLLASSPWFTFQLDMARCLWAILPPALLWGASFPLACAAVAEAGEDSGRVVGGVYAANTLGAVAGALLVSLVLVPAIGTQQTERVLLGISAAGAVFALAPCVRRSRSLPLAAALGVSLVAALWLAAAIDPLPGKVIAYGRRTAVNLKSSTLLYTAEGINSSVAITRWSDGNLEVDVNGHVEATTEPYDMKLQRMVGHLPTLLYPSPRTVLGIGFGAGVSAGTFTRYPSIEKITVCEIEPVIPPTSTHYFAKQDYDVLHDPRTRIIFDDARHYVLTTPEKFDIIASDPLDVFVKGTAALYTKEYFDAIKERLNPGGFFSLYVPLYESDERTVQSELATFFASFPYGTVWANTVDGRGYDMVFLGQAGPLEIDLDQVEARLRRGDYGKVVESLGGVGVYSANDLFGTYAGQKSDLGRWTAGAELNRDRNLRLQYLGGWGVNSLLEDVIYRRMLSFRQMPVGIFTGSAERVSAVLAAIREGR